MRTSNRPIRRIERATLTLLVLGSFLASAAGVVACSSDETNPSTNDRSDASNDGSVVDAIASESGEADAGEAGSSLHDAATSDAAPEPVACASSPCAVSLVTTGTETFCVLLEDETVACWGANGQGLRRTLDLGRGSDSSDSAVAARVVGLTDIRHLDRGCAVDAAGAVWCWGTGPHLQSTTTAYTTEALPVQLPLPPAKSVSIGFLRSGTTDQRYAVGCATVDDGLLCWGTNGMDHLGPRALEASTTDPHDPVAIALPPGAPIQSVVVGQAAFAVRSDGSALSWGQNPPLGRISSLFPDPNPMPIMLNGVTRLDAFHENACAVAQGVVYCWGGNPYGANLYGWDDPMKFAIPKAIATPEPVVDVATSACLGSGATCMQRGCAVGVSGALYCWGNNDNGQVGDGTHDYALQPVKVTGLPGKVSSVKTTVTATCALLTTGQVHCWGDNQYGQLGNGAIQTPSAVPQEVTLP